MAEYIERESLINHVEDLPTWGADGNLLDREDVIGSIENRLAADVAPVRHGRWECGKPCPVCGGDKFDGLDADIWADWEPPYCPNCGAKMDLEDTNG